MRVPDECPKLRRRFRAPAVQTSFYPVDPDCHECDDDEDNCTAMPSAWNHSRFGIYCAHPTMIAVIATLEFWAPSIWVVPSESCADAMGRRAATSERRMDKSSMLSWEWYPGEDLVFCVHARYTCTGAPRKLLQIFEIFN